MCKVFAITFFIISLVMCSLFAGIFVANFDKWCAAPEAGGKYILVPLCGR